MCKCTVGVARLGLVLACASVAGEEWTNALGLRFLLIPAGVFQMGSPPDEVGRRSDETVHEVTLSRPYWLGTMEVTQAQYEKVMGTNPSQFKGPNRPVESVNWDDALAFCAKLSAMEPGNTYRLPTEAEWEYACRAECAESFFWHGLPETGEDADIDGYAWCSGNAGGQTHDVQSKRPNRWGLYDMSGNVWEWCQDWYGEYPSGPVTDPKGTAGGPGRVLRGGGWNNPSGGCRSANRGRMSQSGRLQNLGFRLVRTVQ